MTNTRVLLGVNIDHVATLRQARGTRYPDPVQAAFIAEQAGADGITIHPREDARHIQVRDVRVLAGTLQTRMNLEMAVTEAMIQLAEEVKPEACCLVPEKREELTTEGGLEVAAQDDRLGEYIAPLRDAGCRISLFIGADEAQIRAAARIGAPVVELHTGAYCDYHSEGRFEARDAELARLREGAKLAQSLGLEVHMGHGLTYETVAPIAAMSEVKELNIGHFLIGEAIFRGLPEAMAEMRRLMDEARG